MQIFRKVSLNWDLWRFTAPQQGNRESNIVMTSTPRVAVAYTAQPAFAAAARAKLLEYVADLELEEDRLFAILYAVGEAVANAIEHSSAGPSDTFYFCIERSSDRLLIQVESNGCWKPFEPTEEGGRGVPIMQALADHVNIITNNEKTTVHLSFRL